MQDTIMDIQAYNLAEFCQKVQQAFYAGYEFDFDSNERYPTSFGTFYSAIMKLKEVTPAQVATEAAETASDEFSTATDTNVALQAKDDSTAAKRAKAK